MKLEDLRIAHPDLCAALVEEGRSAGFEAGAAAELNRIKSVEAQSMNGHEALITSLKFDGKTTGPEAAVQVLAAEKTLQTSAMANIVNQAPAAVAFSPAPDDSTTVASAEETSNLSVADQAKAEWDKSAELRAEFGNNLQTYVAYREATASGRVKVANKKD